MLVSGVCSYNIYYYVQRKNHDISRTICIRTLLMSTITSNKIQPRGINKNFHFWLHVMGRNKSTSTGKKNKKGNHSETSENLDISIGKLYIMKNICKTFLSRNTKMIPLLFLLDKEITQDSFGTQQFHTALHSTLIDSSLDSNRSMAVANEEQFSIFVSRKSHPNTVFSEEETNGIIEFISEKRDIQVVTNQKCVQICKILNINGYLKLIVKNQDTLKWLMDICISEIAKRIEINVSNSPPKIEIQLTRCTMKIRSRIKTLNTTSFLLHLSQSNPGFVTNNIVIYDVRELPAKTHKLVIMGIDEIALEYLKAHGGQVFYDVEQTYIIWEELKKEISQNKRKKIDNI